MTNLFTDGIINDTLQQLTLEFVTFEASQYVDTYTAIEFDFPADGLIEYKINVFTMQLNMYRQ